MASFQDILGKLIPECQTVLDFAAARYDGDVSGDNWNSKTCKSPAKPQMSYHILL